ncbi:MAG: iron chelate uptake ABC transporter family permease subunit, partial [Acidobacteriia bacterium]|nr:iron chelate uptake ABC transporter family permease subunit [Terriglobia bacterium]
MADEPVTRWTVIKAVALAAGVALATLLLAPLIGSTRIDLHRAFGGLSPEREVLFELRLTRVLLAMIAGGCLALAGGLFQALLRDALATPYTLGVSSGASLGAVLALTMGWRAAGSLPAIWLASFAGAAIVLAIVMRLASEGGRMSSFTLLLAGVTINSICMALILFLHSTAGFTQSFAITRWLMGGI